MNTLRPWLSIGAGAAAAAMLCFAAPPAPAAEPASAPAARVFDLETATIADINAAFDAGALTSERLVELYLARIEAYDKQGPRINAVITLNPAALETARALDAERARRDPAARCTACPSC